MDRAIQARQYKQGVTSQVLQASASCAKNKAGGTAALEWLTARSDGVFRRAADSCRGTGNEAVTAAADGGDRVPAAQQLPPHAPHIDVNRAGCSAGIVEPLQEPLQFLPADGA